MLRRWFAVCLVGLSLGFAQAAEVSIVGTGDGFETLQHLARAYEIERAGKKIKIPPSIGSGGGISAVGSDTEILGRVARPLSDKEKALGITYRPLMHIPIAIIAQKEAGISALTAQQLVDIYSGKITSWKEIGGADIRIRVVRREDADSSHMILRASMPGWRDLVITPRSRIATTTQEAITLVLDNPGAIGFVPYAEVIGKDVVAISIDGAKPLDDAYPSAVTVALIYKPAKLNADAKDALQFLFSESAATIIRQSGAKVAKP